MQQPASTLPLPVARTPPTSPPHASAPERAARLERVARTTATDADEAYADTVNAAAARVPKDYVIIDLVRRVLRAAHLDSVARDTPGTASPPVTPPPPPVTSPIATASPDRAPDNATA